MTKTEKTPGGGKTTIVQTRDPHLTQLLDTVATMFEAERQQDLGTWASKWAEGARVTFPIDATPGERDVVGKDAIVAWTAAKFVDRDRSDINATLEALAERNRVFAYVDVTLHFANQTKISGPLLMAYTFDEEGRVILMEEFVNEAVFPSNYKDLASAE